MTQSPQTAPAPEPIASDPGRAGNDSFFDNLRRHDSSADYQNIERRTHSNTVFLVDEPIRTSFMPRPTHWSVAWSDLMMTMFVLFLCMYAYQSANEHFMGKKKPEIIGGDTTEALQTIDAGKATLPFQPIRPGLPLIAAGTVKKVEKVGLDQVKGLPVEPTFPKGELSPPAKSAKPAASTSPGATTTPSSGEREKVAVLIPGESPSALAVPPVPLPDEDIVQPRPMVGQDDPSASPPADTFREIYRVGRGALETNDLEDFASIDIVPDQTVRIILTSDLLFGLGESVLSEKARSSLEKVAAAIRYTPYMINVVGHTDNIPMRSSLFKSNWELSVARASSVARYLIEEMGMDPSQFVVSGYSSYRPIAPNTTADNRAKNRRVEIIISKRLPEPLPATAENLR